MNFEEDIKRTIKYYKKLLKNENRKFKFKGSLTQNKKGYVITVTWKDNYNEESNISNVLNTLGF